MAETGATVTEPQHARAGRRRVPWHRVRTVLIVAWLALMASALVLGQRSGRLSDLESAAASGRISSVTVTGDGPGASGASLQQVRWRAGWRDGFIARTATVQVTGPDDDPTSGGGRRTERITATDLQEHLADLNPNVLVGRGVETDPPANVYGWALPAWVAAGLIIVDIVTLGMLLDGPQPWRATRWAWFWLWLTPIGAPAFLVLGGAGGPLPAPRDLSRRLTGGWAFLLLLIIGNSHA